MPVERTEKELVWMGEVWLGNLPDEPCTMMYIWNTSHISRKNNELNDSLYSTRQAPT